MPWILLSEYEKPIPFVSWGKKHKAGLFSKPSAPSAKRSLLAPLLCPFFHSPIFFLPFLPL